MPSSCVSLLTTWYARASLRVGVLAWQRLSKLVDVTKNAIAVSSGDHDSDDGGDDRAGHAPSVGDYSWRLAVCQFDGVALSRAACSTHAASTARERLSARRERTQPRRQARAQRRVQRGAIVDTSRTVVPAGPSVTVVDERRRAVASAPVMRVYALGSHSTAARDRDHDVDRARRPRRPSSSSRTDA